MKSLFLAIGVISLAGIQSSAQLAEATRVPGSSRHTFGVQSPLWFNTSLTMSGSAQLLYRSGGLTGDRDVDGRIDRFYDDGFVRVNSLGNPNIPLTGSIDAVPRTTYFGFTSNDQVTLPQFAKTPIEPGYLSLHNIEIGTGEYTLPLDSQDPGPSIELFYRYHWIERPNWAIGFEAGLSWLRMEWDTTKPVGAMTTVYEDQFISGTVNPRVDVQGGGTLPYDGFYEPVGGAPWIGSYPIRQDPYDIPALVASQRSLSHDSGILRLGPALDWIPADRLRLGVLGGLAVGVSHSSYSFYDRITIDNPVVPLIIQSGTGGFWKAWAGLYAAARVTLRVTDRWSLLAEGRRIWMNEVDHEENGRVFNIGSGEGYGLSFGLSWRY